VVSLPHLSTELSSSYMAQVSLLDLTHPHLHPPTITTHHNHTLSALPVPQCTVEQAAGGREHSWLAHY